MIHQIWGTRCLVVNKHSSKERGISNVDGIFMMYDRLGLDYFQFYMKNKKHKYDGRGSKTKTMTTTRYSYVSTVKRRTKDHGSVE